MGQNWRRFDAEIETIYTRTSSEIISSEPFKPLGEPPKGGGSMAMRVSVGAGGNIAWAKPARAGDTGNRHSGHEKIASDLGYVLGLPTVPVVLSRETTGLPLAPIVALSFEVLKQGRPWDQMGALLTPEKMEILRPTLSAMWVFHAWIHDTDHNWNGGNVIVEIDATGHPNVAFIDYSFSLTHGWTPPAPCPPAPWDSPPGDPYAPHNRDAMNAVVSKIQQLSATELGVLVKRIPAECMTEDMKNHLFEGLDSRRADLRSVLRLEDAK